MKVLNKGEQFSLTFAGHDVVVPSGLSREYPSKVAYHIQFVAEKWGKDIKLIDNKQQEQEVLNELKEMEKLNASRMQESVQDEKAVNAEKELKETAQPLDPVNLKKQVKKADKKQAKKNIKSKK